MDTMDRRIAELRHELSMLYMALEFINDPADRDCIFERLNVRIVEYAQMVDGRASAIIPKDKARPTEG
jgi:hypothetical protein